MNNINELVISKDDMLGLFKKGFRPEKTVFCWTNLYSGDGTYTIYETDALVINDYDEKDENGNYIFIPTLTFQELICTLPYSITDYTYQYYKLGIDLSGKSLFYYYKGDVFCAGEYIIKHKLADFNDIDLINAGVKMLEWCIDNHFIKRNI